MRNSPISVRKVGFASPATLDQEVEVVLVLI
jgi:hypothetical protein